MSNQSHPATILVRGLPTAIEECDLVEAFSSFGAVQTAVVARFSKDGPSLGYGFVTFSSHETAEKACSIVDGRAIDCKYLIAKLSVLHCKDCSPSFSRERGSRIEKRKLYVSHFGDALDSKALGNLFQKFGSVTSSQVVTNDLGKSRGYGFVTFGTAEEAAHALSEMQNLELPNQVQKLAQSHQIFYVPGARNAYWWSTHMENHTRQDVPDLATPLGEFLRNTTKKT